MKKLKYTLTNKNDIVKNVSQITTKINLSDGSNFIESFDLNNTLNNNENLTITSSLAEENITKVVSTDFLVNYTSEIINEYIQITKENMMNKDSLYIKKYESISGVSVDENIFNLIRKTEQTGNVYSLNTRTDEEDPDIKYIEIIHTDLEGGKITTTLYKSIDGGVSYSPDESTWTDIPNGGFLQISLYNQITEENYNIQESTVNLDSLLYYSELICIKNII